MWRWSLFLQILKSNNNIHTKYISICYMYITQYVPRYEFMSIEVLILAKDNYMNDFPFIFLYNLWV